MNITIVGVGALGSHLAAGIRNEGALKLIDFDVVESKNLLAQLHTKQALRRNKATALKALFFQLWGVGVTDVPTRLTKDNVQQLFGGSDLIVDAVDNGEARRLIQAFARTGRPTVTPCVHLGIAGDGTFGRVVWDEHFTVDDEPAGGGATCEGGEHLPMIQLIAATGALAIQQFVKHDRRRNFSVALGSVRGF